MLLPALVEHYGGDRCGAGGVVTGPHHHRHAGTNNDTMFFESFLNSHVDLALSVSTMRD